MSTDIRLICDCPLYEGGKYGYTMRKLIQVLLSAVLGVGLLAGFLVATGHSTPPLNIDTIQKAGFGGDNTSSRTTDNKATFAKPDKGEWFKSGPHHSGQVFSGSWFWQGHDNWWCVNFSKHSGDGIHNATVHGKLPGFTRANSKSALKIMNAETGLVSRVTGLSTVKKINSVKSWAIWFLSNDKALHADWNGYKAQIKSHGEGGAFNQLLAWGRNHGPYNVAVKLPKTAVGQTGHGKVTVKAANGNPASNMQVSLSGNDNMTVSPQGGMTNAKGQLSFKFKPTDFGLVKMNASVTAPSSNAGLLTDASPGRQQLLTGHYQEHASGSAKFRTVKGTVEVSTQCVTNCDGLSTVTWKAKTPASSNKPMRFRFYIGSNVVGHCDSAPGVPCEFVKRVPDGQHYKGYDFCTLDKKDGNCISTWQRVKRDREIICPPEPSATMHLSIDISCPCGGTPTKTGEVDATVTSLAGSPRFFTATLTDVTTGAATTVDLTNGSPGAMSLPFYNGDDYQVSYKVFDHSGGSLLKQGVIIDQPVNLP